MTQMKMHLLWLRTSSFRGLAEIGAATILTMAVFARETMVQLGANDDLDSKPTELLLIQKAMSESAWGGNIMVDGS